MSDFYTVSLSELENLPCQIIGSIQQEGHHGAIMGYESLNIGLVGPIPTHVTGPGHL